MPKRSLTVTSKDGQTMTADINLELEYSDSEWEAFQQAVQDGINYDVFIINLTGNNWIVKPNPLYGVTLGMGIQQEYSIPALDSDAGNRAFSLDGICLILHNAGKAQQHAYSAGVVPEGDTLESATYASRLGLSKSAGLSKDLVNAPLPSIKAEEVEQSPKHLGRKTLGVQFTLPHVVFSKLSAAQELANAQSGFAAYPPRSGRGSVASTDSSSNDGANAAAAPGAKSSNPFAGCLSACFGWMHKQPPLTKEQKLVELAKGSNQLAVIKDIANVNKDDGSGVGVVTNNVPTRDGRPR